MSAFEGGGEAKREIGAWIERYNQRRPHSSLDDKTPFEAYTGACLCQEQEPWRRLPEKNFTPESMPETVQPRGTTSVLLRAIAG
ncbi:MAG: integrase core domain-containing protein [Nitrospinota bacterium]